MTGRSGATVIGMTAHMPLIIENYPSTNINGMRVRLRLGTIFCLVFWGCATTETWYSLGVDNGCHRKHVEDEQQIVRPSSPPGTSRKQIQFQSNPPALDTKHSCSWGTSFVKPQKVACAKAMSHDQIACRCLAAFLHSYSTLTVYSRASIMKTWSSAFALSSSINWIALSVEWNIVGLSVVE